MAAIDEGAIAERWRLHGSKRDERGRRRWAAAEARSHGRGGIAAVVRSTPVSESTIRRGLVELDAGEAVELGRVRRVGGGRKPITVSDPTLVADLERMVEPDVRGDPERPLRWSSKSGAKLAAGLRAAGHQVADRTVLTQLKVLGYSLQANRKTKEGSQHPDRDAQFRHINETVRRQLSAREPVISVDTKKKELVGDFKNGGREWRPKGSPELVRTHDFKDKELGKAIPYGIYDLADDTGWVNVGIDSDTAQFAVSSIRGWWKHLGKKRYPNATTLTITADCGGSNGNRTRLWKVELQRFADETGLTVQVCHFPPGTSKWNKIEHRLFSFISVNWRGKPLTSLEVIINLIGNTTTRTGLDVYAQVDPRSYPRGIKVTNAQLAAVNLTPDQFHPDWNYTVTPSLINA
jgi:Rhodopirellula transposase DDE domain